MRRIVIVQHGIDTKKAQSTLAMTSTLTLAYPGFSVELLLLLLCNFLPFGSTPLLGKVNLSVYTSSHRVNNYHTIYGEIKFLEETSWDADREKHITGATFLEVKKDVLLKGLIYTV